MCTQIHVFVTLALVGVEWSASRPDRFTTGKIVPGTQLERRLSKSDPSVDQPVASRYTDSALHIS
jgi:hypothetical protein